MLVIVEKYNEEMEYLYKKLSSNGIKIEIIEEKDIQILKSGKSFNLVNKKGDKLKHTKLLTIGRLSYDLISLLSSVNYNCLNNIHLVKRMYTQFDAIMEISELFPSGFSKVISYKNCKLTFEFIPTEVKTVIVSSEIPVDLEYEWIINKLVSKGLKLFKLTIGKKDNKWYPLSIIPYVSYHDLDSLSWEKIIEREVN